MVITKAFATEIYCRQPGRHWTKTMLKHTTIVFQAAGLKNNISAFSTQSKGPKTNDIGYRSLPKSIG